MTTTAAPPAERIPAAPAGSSPPPAPAASTSTAAPATTTATAATTAATTTTSTTAAAHTTAAAGVIRCDNCGAAVPGRYCGACGQRLEPPLHSLWHFLTVAAEDVTHADSRLWRTLAALLFKPGFLTREFLHGRRASYLPPVRLYLVLSVAFFLCATLRHSEPRVVEITTDHGAPKAMHVMPLEEAADAADKAAGGAKPGETVEQRNQRECALIDYQGPWQARLTPAIRDACLKIRADKGRSLQEALYHNMPRALFLFLPLLAGAMMLLYWRPQHYYVEHLLLFVHNHAAVFLLVMLAWGLSALMPRVAGWVDFAVTLYIPWYVFRSMRVVYGQSRGLTLAKLVPLSFFYLVSGALMFTLTFLYSAFTL